MILAPTPLWGLGWTFRSGAFDAWLADEVGQERLAGVYTGAPRSTASPGSSESG